MAEKHKINHQSNQLHSIFLIENGEHEFLKFFNPEFAYAYYLEKRVDLVSGEIQNY